MALSLENRKKDEKNQSLENYKKNLLRVQDMMDRILTHMKGHDASFRSEITDRSGAFSQEKLCGLVEKILSLWAEKQQDGTFSDPDSGESLAKSYIDARRELYGSYLYLIMRCSLLQGKYALVCGSDRKERTDFAFLLEQAKILFRAWCVVEYPGGEKKNELFWGYDNHFGFHLYRIFSSHPDAGLDNFLAPESCWPVNHPALLTDEGNIRRTLFKKIYPGGNPLFRAKKAAQPDENEDADADSKEEYGCDSGERDDIEEDYNDYDPGENEDWWDDWDIVEEDDEAQYEETKRVMERRAAMEYLYGDFAYSEEYLRACRLFRKRFQEAEPDVMWRFCEDLEEMMDLYLAEKNIPPLMDEDTALEIYEGICDGPYRQARRCAKGIQWKNLRP